MANTHKKSAKVIPFPTKDDKHHKEWVELMKYFEEIKDNEIDHWDYNGSKSDE